jgi:hypothetical protein
MNSTYAQTSNEDQGDTEDKLPPVPTEKELAGFTDQQLYSFIAWVANGFEKELGQFNTGDTWVKYFQLDNLRSLAPKPPRGTVAQQTPTGSIVGNQNLVSDVLNRLDTAAKNDQYRTIAETWGFKALQTALKEASRPTEERAVGVLKGQTEILNKSLERVSTGDSWRKHLEIDSLQQLVTDKNIAANENVDKIAEKFDRVVKNPEYQSIVQLPGFQGVYSSLHQLADGRQPESSAARRTPPPPESETR